MDKMEKRRWACWAVLLSATVGAIAYPSDDQMVEPTQKLSPSDSLANVGAQRRASASVVQTAAPQAGTAAADPFAPRLWQASTQENSALQTPPAATVATVTAAMPTEPSAPIGAPPLPFHFVGQMDDDGAHVVYLTRGDQAVVAQVGETLEGVYKVVSFSAESVEFEYLPTGDKQVLTIAAPN